MVTRCKGGRQRRRRARPDRDKRDPTAQRTVARIARRPASARRAKRRAAATAASRALPPSRPRQREAPSGLPHAHRATSVRKSGDPSSRRRMQRAVFRKRTELARPASGGNRGSDGSAARPASSEAQATRRPVRAAAGIADASEAAESGRTEKSAPHPGFKQSQRAAPQDAICSATVPVDTIARQRNSRARGVPSPRGRHKIRVGRRQEAPTGTKTLRYPSSQGLPHATPETRPCAKGSPH